MNTVTVLVGAGVIVFIVIVIAGMIADSKKTWQILQWVLLGLGAILLGWIATKFKVNIGKYVSNMIGKRKNLPATLLNTSGEVIGKEVEIVNRNNPVRDVGTIVTSDGQQFALPSGVMDKDVTRVTVIGDTDYRVEVKHEKLSDLFDTTD